MADIATEIYRLLYEDRRIGQRRYTQDTPILPDVWVKFATSAPLEAISLLITPHSDYRAPEVLRLLKDHRLLPDDARAAANESHVRLTANLPQTLALLRASRWVDLFRDRITRVDALTGAVDWIEQRAANVSLSDPTALKQSVLDDLFLQSPHLDIPYQAAIEFWALVAVVAAYSASRPEVASAPKGAQGFEAFSERLISALGDVDVPHFIWSITVNREGEFALVESRKTVKADAAQQLFRVGGRGIRWAVIDSGIDAMHPAFVDRRKLDGGLAAAPTNPSYPADPQHSRVVETLDFTRLDGLLQDSLTDPQRRTVRLTTGLTDQQLQDQIDTLRQDLYSGRMLDWSRLASLLRVRHDKAGYAAPQVQHGTHVAGIIGADWRRSDYLKKVPAEIESGDLIGMCPEIEFVDLRVFSQDRTDEFTLLAALQYLRWLNQSKDQRYVHGANLSFSLPHDVRNYACGRTPICEECERLWGTGLVLVAAAGNYGFAQPKDAFAMGDAYRNISLTDPGNAECVITVGSTHRSAPHAYGVSYFSSRGPTGDGRMKPDLLAPGEKIQSTVPGGGVAVQDGTSMAAPHVSGIAALVMSRNPELQGQPNRIKTLLCNSATDLGRERYFQGAGLVDVLRALQSV